MREVANHDDAPEVNGSFKQEQFDEMAAKCRPRGMYWPLGEELPWLRDAVYQMQRAPTEKQRPVIANVLDGLVERGGVARVQVGHVPRRDIETERNLTALRSGLADIQGPDGPIAFEVELWCGTAECDGRVKPSCPIPFEPLSRASAEFSLPGPFVLEIGQTRPEATWRHLVHGGAVARWAYGDDCLTILAIDPARSIMGDITSRLGIGSAK